MAEESIILISKDYADSNLIERGEYTKLENKVNGKQDMLTAGTGINLNNNTISVDTATTVDDSNLPVTASAVNTKLGDYVNDIQAADSSITVTKSGSKVTLKANGGGSTDNNPRFRIVTWNVNDPMAYFGKRPARPEDATVGHTTLEQFNNACQQCCSSAFAVALNEYTWLVTRGEGMWNDNDFGVFCWSGLNYLNDGYECHWCDLPESTLPL